MLKMCHFIRSPSIFMHTAHKYTPKMCLLAGFVWFGCLIRFYSMKALKRTKCPLRYNVQTSSAERQRDRWGMSEKVITNEWASWDGKIMGTRMSKSCSPLFLFLFFVCICVCRSQTKLPTKYNDQNRLHTPFFSLNSTLLCLWYQLLLLSLLLLALLLCCFSSHSA